MEHARNRGDSGLEVDIMSSGFTLFAPRWFGWQMNPGYLGERCVPYFSPIHITRVQPLKTGKGLLELDFLNACYAEGLQHFRGVRIKVLLRGANYLLGHLVDYEGEMRSAIISHIEFRWLPQCCPEIIRSHDPEAMGPPYAGSVSLYLGHIYRSTRKSEEKPDLDNESENEWLTYCSLRFNAYLYAQKHGLEEQPYDFCEEFMRDASLGGDPQYLMTAMFMLQRRLMKEGVRSKTCRAWCVFRLLFLRLCNEQFPEEYRGPFFEEWERKFRPQLKLGIEIVEAFHQSAKYDSSLF
jgi:hypothetical protein